MIAAPVNFSSRPVAEIPGDVDYAISNANFYADQIRKHHGQIVGARVLEIGPGVNFGINLLLDAMGAKVTVADRFLAPWDPAYHGVFYSALRDAYGGPKERLTRVIETRSYDGVLGLVPQPAEAMTLLADDTFDVILSNAAIEHVYDMPAVAAEFRRITAPGGVHIHQIDFRDHFNFNTPLEFLLIDDAAYAEIFRTSHGERGNRLRPDEVIHIFIAAGFDLFEIDPNTLADEGYLSSFAPRLRQCASRYKDYSLEQLRPVCARLFLRASAAKPVGVSRQKSELTDAMRQHVGYAASIAKSYLKQIQRAGIDLNGARVLELGPGSDFGPALILASHGATVSIADVHLHKQDMAHHAALSAALVEFWDGPNDVLKRAVAQGDYKGCLALIDAPVESLPVEDGAFDLVLSNAVIEHVGDLPRAAREPARVTAANGVNCHQIDYRDHRNFDRPLEHLLAADEIFAPEAEWRGQFGCRWRRDEAVQFFFGAGFTLFDEWQGEHANEDYLRDFIPRLKASRSRYRDWRPEDISLLGGRLSLRKTA